MSVENTTPLVVRVDVLPDRFQRYQYQALPSDQHIRLLQVKQDTSSHEYFYHLQSFALSRLPEYYALSYTWGPAVKGEPPGKDGLLPMNHSFLQIGGNLADFLTLCESSKMLHDPDQWIWIDAICIDQQNIHERESQVALMGQIYSKTPSIIVWLGQSESNLESILWTNGAFYEAVVEMIENEGKGRFQQYSFTTLEFYNKLSLSMSYEEYLQIWVSYTDFYLSRQWFRRGWVIQEIASAADALVLIGKGHVFLWNQLMAIAKYVAEMGCRVGDNNIGKKMTENVCMFMDIQEALSADRSVMSKYDPLGSVLNNIARSRRPEHIVCALFYYMVQHSNSFSTTDPRDKVYCALGFANRKRGKHLPAVAVQPSYTKTVDEVFRETTAYFLQCLKPSVVLSRASGNRGTVKPQLPSWVVDLEISDSILGITLAGMFPGGYEAWPDQASKELPLVVNGNCLSISGVIFDTLVTVALLPTCPDFEGLVKALEICRGAELRRGTNQTWADSVLRMLVGWEPEEPGVNEHNDSFDDDESGSSQMDCHQILARWVCLHIYQQSSGNPAALGELRDLSEFDASLPTKSQMMENVERLLQMTEKKQVKDSDALQTLLLGDQQSDPWLKHETWQKEYNRTARGRSIFRTSKGTLGLAPQWVQSGDEVVFLRGGSVPYIMRKQLGGQEYRFVGEAYVHGFMKGEAITAEFLAMEKHLHIV